MTAKEPTATLSWRSRLQASCHGLRPSMLGRVGRGDGLGGCSRAEGGYGCHADASLLVGSGDPVTASGKWHAAKWAAPLPPWAASRGSSTRQRSCTCGQRG